MVPQVLRCVVSSEVGHPVSMRGILAFLRPEFLRLGGGASRRFDALAGHSPPMEGFVPGRVRVSDGGG